MTRDEFVILANTIRSFYPRENFLPTNEARELWYMELQDLDYRLAETAIHKHVQRSKWCPTIAEIRSEVVSVQDKSEDWSVEWGKVLRAVGRYGYTNTEKALESLEPLTADIVKRLGWKQICQCELNGLIALRGNFRMIYEQQQKAEREKAALSKGLQDKINKIRIGNNETILLGEQDG